MNISYDNYGKSNIAPEEDNVIIEIKEVNLFNDYPLKTNVAADNSSQSIVEESDQLQAVGVELDAEDQSEDINEIMSELKQLIGLTRVKHEIRRLMYFMRVQDLRRTRGITNTQMALHSVFSGNPGTGKTTVARLYGRMLKALNILSIGHIIETDRSGLVGNYIGTTATKTDEIVREALGGVLFIDEAYSLAKDDEARWDYGQEALQVLVKRMEDHRDNFVVIVAGYPKPMERFLRSNEGLRSRFSIFIHFDDYPPEELLEIYQLFCENENYTQGEEALGLVLTEIKSKYIERDDSFGNARFVRNLFEAVIRNHAMRVGLNKEVPSDMELRTILPDDVRNAEVKENTIF